MSLPRLACLLLLAVSLGAGACGDDTASPADAATVSDPDAATDAAADPDATTDATPDPDAQPVCCPIEEPTCDCFTIGGTQDDPDPVFGCMAICDAEPDGWVEGVDENGCPILEWVGGTGSCFPLPDAGVP